jgi:AcrR family transcriptional regulator
MNLSTPPVPSTRDEVATGRVNQKRRTRQALLDAALALSESGVEPSLQDVAERALISRATAYRYFTSVEALLHEAYLERFVQTIEASAVAGEDPVDAIGRAAESVNRLLLQDEVGMHVIERSFMQVWLDNAADARPPRAARRVKFIEPILAKLADRLDAPARRRLRTALTLVMGVEAVLSMRDVGGASVEETIDAGTWAARALVKQALNEAASDARPRATRTRRKRAR